MNAAHEEELADLELPVATMRRMLDGASERVLRHLEGVGRQHAAGDEDGAAVEAMCRRLREDVPEHGVALEPLLDAFFDDYVPRCLTTNGPGYLAYIPGGGIFPAAIADLVADATNRFTGTRFGSPPLVALEASVLDWFRDWMGFPPQARGVFTTGGSMANFNAIVCAREDRVGAELRRGVVYTSTQAHHSIAKAARLAGILGDRVRLIPVDASFRMRIDALERSIREDRAAGLLPFMVASAGGTTNTGAVDPLEALAEVCEREGLWHHVDGAYGAFFHACLELRPLLAGLSRADSITLDPHKGLFLPYGTGALLVREGAALRKVHSAQAAYFPDRADDDVYDPSLYGPDLSRGFPGLRVWLTVKLFGAAKLRAAIAEKRRLACVAAERIGAMPGIAMIAPPQLSLFAFHVRCPGGLEEENGATRELLRKVAARGRVYLTGCTHEGRFLARVCVLSFRTRAAHADQCCEDVGAALEEIGSRDVRAPGC